MEVDGKLQDSKLKAVSVGGLARPDGKIQHGFRGCIQVCSLYILWFPFLLACTNSSAASKQYSFNVFVFFSLQGLRVGGALSLSQARKVNVEQGCSVPDPCSSSPCPANSYCSDDWDSYSCTCLNGQSVVIFRNQSHLNYSGI